ncbi:hypothetical protein H0X06_01475 [Candidatus Dependentiae bacterium]|nr:hypothetical protein [Candidatus Dependentiae bacterium]
MRVLRVVTASFLWLIICATFYADASQFVPVFLRAVKNTSSSQCTIEKNIVPSRETLQFSQPLSIPFISIRNYLKEYTADRPYVPKQALKIDTGLGRFRVWASETGVMYAPDIKQEHFSSDTWEAEKICGNTKVEHESKSRCLLIMVLKVLKNRLKITLEPV